MKATNPSNKDLREISKDLYDVKSLANTIATDLRSDNTAIINILTEIRDILLAIYTERPNQYEEAKAKSKTKYELGE